LLHTSLRRATPDSQELVLRNLIVPPRAPHKQGANLLKTKGYIEHDVRVLLGGMANEALFEIRSFEAA
jgi:hypothetical protein